MTRPHNIKPGAKRRPVSLHRFGWSVGQPDVERREMERQFMETTSASSLIELLRRAVVALPDGINSLPLTKMPVKRPRGRPRKIAPAVE